MELYIRDTLNDVQIENKVSLFGDEEVVLTKKWNDIQVIAGYGSFSQSFSVPLDANNAKIFKYYDIIGGFYVQATGFTNNSFNPNYFLPARIVINEYEIIGNVQVVGFSTVDDERYAYQITFYGEEKNLIRDLNASDFPKLNDMILSDIDFTLNFENVISTWTGTNTMHFVPLIATKKPLNYRDEKQIGNINSSAADTAKFSGLTGITGVDMNNLTVTYNLQQILERMLITNNIQLSATTQVYTFLENLYLGINTKVDYAGGDLTYVYTEAMYANTVTLSGSSYNKLNMTTSTLTETGIINGNTDLISWNNIADYANSDDTYTAQSNGDYTFTLTIKQLVDQISIMNVTTHRVKIVDVTTGAVLFSVANKTAPRTITATIALTAGQKIMFLVNYQFKSFIFLNGQFQITYYDGVYYDDQISCTLKAQLVSAASYNIKKSTINFPDMLMSDFFVNFCKSFNIMFIYEDLETIDTNVYRFVGTWSGNTAYFVNDVVEYNGLLYRSLTGHTSSPFVDPPSSVFVLTDSSILYPIAKMKVTMYFKEELPSTIYELDNYLLLDKAYTYNTDPKYKLINYKFADAKDINNISWKTGRANGYEQLGSTNVGGLAFGELKTYYNYDVGIDKLEYKSMFTVFPRTTLNYTDNDNIILSGTEIVLHSELNESLSEIQTDFLLMYRNQMITAIDHTYNIQNSATGYTEIDYVADYSANGGQGYMLDYNEFQNAIKDNVTNRFKVTYEFKLNPQILYNIKVYDIIIVRGIWYEIIEMNIDIKTGYAQITLLSTTYRRSGDIEAASPTTTTTTTAGTTTTTTTAGVAQLVFDWHGAVGNIYVWGIDAGDVILTDTDVFGITTTLSDFGTPIASFPHVLTGNLVYTTNPPIPVVSYVDHFYASINGVYTYVTINWYRT